MNERDQARRDLKIAQEKTKNFPKKKKKKGLYKKYKRVRNKTTA